MLELNKIYNIDCLEGLRQIEDGSIDIIITSPPYNKIGLNGFKTHGKKNGWVGEILYNDDKNEDNMPEEEYQRWQVEILRECYRVLKPNGSLFYNHKPRIINGQGDTISPLKWIWETPFKVRQEIVWDRGNCPNCIDCRFIPNTERIWWLTKSATPVFKRGSDIRFKGEVWKIAHERDRSHPAPFPLELPDNILDNFSGDLIVLDPFMGSGTTALSAKNHGFNFIGFEKFKKYIDIANKRLNNN